MARELLLTFATFGLLCVSIVELTSILQNGRQPNIVFVIADDLGWHDVSYHGSRIQTPTLDKLSENGIRLENYYVQPMCSPTRCQLMTGRYQIHNGMQHYLFEKDRPSGLPLDSPTLPDKLREAGYSTHFSGKWHLGFFKEDYMPLNRGFDTSFGFMGGNQDHYDHTSSYKKIGKFLDLRFNGEPALNYSGQYSTYMYTDHAVNIINTHDKNKPLFLYMAYQAPHSPLEVPESYIDQYRDIDDKNRRKFAGMVTALDEGVANLTKALQDNGMWNDTLFIFTTDNGGNPGSGHRGNNYPLRGEKFELWEGGIRAVGFVAGGANVDMIRGAVSNQLTHVSDWFPTLIGVAGGNLNDTLPLDGIDQWESMSTGKPTTRTWLLHNIDPLKKKKGETVFEDTFNTKIRAALRVGDMKILTGDPGKGKWTPPPEMGSLKVEDLKEKKKNLWLFNITADPEERIDLSESEPEKVKEMLDFLAQVDNTSVPVWWPAKDPEADPRKHGNVWSPWQ